MIQDFVYAWDENKSKLEEYIRTHKQEEYDEYVKLLRLLISLVINPYFSEKKGFTWMDDLDEITVVDNGHYQGSQLFIVPKNTYQPDAEDYFWTYQFYGSCSGCDTLQGIQMYESGLPNEDQVKEYMTLELHLLQKCRFLLEKDGVHNDFMLER